MPSPRVRCRSRIGRRSSKQLPRATSSRYTRFMRWLIASSSPWSCESLSNREIAEELTIDVFHDVWRRASRYDAANGTVLGWIMNQARSRAIDRLRFENRKKRSNGCDSQPLTNGAADPHDLLELREQGQSLRAALAALTPDERQAIETTFFAGLTHAEAAARLNQPLGTIKTRIRSGLDKLRRTLTAEVGKP